jgi:hypothetical protein
MQTYIAPLFKIKVYASYSGKIASVVLDDCGEVGRMFSRATTSPSVSLTHRAPTRPRQTRA